MSQPWQGKRVLIVDDSVRSQDDARKVFTEAGLVVVGVAKHGVEALEKVAELAPDLVSIDIIMPVMDGIECYRRLAATGRQTEYLFLSALAADPRVIACYEGEIEPYRFIAKPATLTVIQERLDAIYGHAGRPLPPPPPPAPVAMEAPAPESDREIDYEIR